MKVIRYLAAAALALTATTAMAQGGPPGGGQGGGQAMTQMLFKDITLTASQQVKVDSIVAAARAESMKLRQEAQAAGGPPSPELRAKMTEVTTKRNEAIKAVLTAEQQPVFAKNLEAMAAMMQQRQRPPR